MRIVVVVVVLLILIVLTVILNLMNLLVALLILILPRILLLILHMLIVLLVILHAFSSMILHALAVTASFIPAAAAFTVARSRWLVVTRNEERLRINIHGLCKKSSKMLKMVQFLEFPNALY